MPKTNEEYFRDQVGAELVEAKDDMEALREEYSRVVIQEQRLRNYKGQLEFQQQEQEGRINQLKELLNPALKKKRGPIIPKPPERIDEVPDPDKDKSKKKDSKKKSESEDNDAGK